MIRHKFNAVKTVRDDITFHSKKEAKRYDELVLLKASGEVLFFLRQVPFHMPGKVKYLCDFMVFWADDTVTVEDVKGMKTATYIMKKKMVEALYPIKITEI